MKNAAKEYLLQVKAADTAIRQKQKELEDLKRSMYSVRAIGYEGDKVQTSGSGDPYMAVDKYIDMNKSIKADMGALVELKHRIIGEIQGLGNNVYVELLYKRYIEYKSLWEVAREMHYSYDRIRHCHGLALLAFRKKYNIE